MIARIVAQHIIAKKTKEKSKKDQLPKMPAVKLKTKKKLKPDVPILDTNFKKGFQNWKYIYHAFLLDYGFQMDYIGHLLCSKIFINDENISAILEFYNV